MFQSRVLPFLDLRRLLPPPPRALIFFLKKIDLIPIPRKLLYVFIHLLVAVPLGPPPGELLCDPPCPERLRDGNHVAGVADNQVSLRFIGELSIFKAQARLPTPQDGKMPHLQ